MFGISLTSSQNDLREGLRVHHSNLDAGCRLYGLTATMFRALREAFNIITLLFAVYLIEFTPSSWEIAVGVAIVLVLGPAGIEEYLTRRGILADGDSAKGAD